METVIIRNILILDKRDLHACRHIPLGYLEGEGILSAPTGEVDESEKPIYDIFSTDDSHFLKPTTLTETIAGSLATWYSANGGTHHSERSFLNG